MILIDISLHGRVISHLNVSSVHSSDGGLYRCQAQNSVSFFNILDIVGDNMYLYLRWVWSLTPQGWMCMVRHHRVVCRMSPLSRGFRIFYQHPRDTLLEAPNISDDTKLERKGTLLKPNIPPESWYNFPQKINSPCSCSDGMCCSSVPCLVIPLTR